MAWIEWHGKILPTTDALVDISCSIYPPESSARQQSWALSLHQSIHNPDIKTPRYGSLELSLSLEQENLGFHLSDWSHLGRQTIIATPDWHAQAESINPFGGLENTWLSLHIIQHDPASNDYLYSEWLADYFRITLSPSADNRFPCEIDAWFLRKEDFLMTEPLRGDEIHRIPTDPPNLRILGLARFDSGKITFQSHNADPEPIARRLLAETIALHDPSKLYVKWWAETERKINKRELPPPPAELRRVDVNFRLPPE